MISRPFPPDDLLARFEGVFLPAPEVVSWIKSALLDEAGPLHNPDHHHLNQAILGVLWTNVANARQLRRVVGTAEMPLFRGGAWVSGRQEQQLREWFGDVPDFLITLDAHYAQQASDAEWSALVEHELYHCAQALDEFGAPKFSREGLPKFAIRGHDVEEFVGVVRRYGIGNAAGAAAQLVQAAACQPEVARVDIARACGTCMLKSA